MKNIFKYILITILFVLPISVNALGFSCDSGTYSYGDTFKCRLTGTANQIYRSVSATIDENEYIYCKVDKYSLGLLPNDDKTVINTSGKVEGEGEVPFVELACNVKIKTTDNIETQIVLKNVQYELADDGILTQPEIVRSNMLTIEKYVNKNTTTTTTDSKPRDTSNGNSLLKKLGDPELNKYFTFSKFITKYNFEVLFDVDKIDLQYETNVEDATVRIEGNQKLEVGENVIDVYVTSPDNTSQTCYTLTITRLPSGQTIYYPEKDATLKKLEIKGHPITFESVIKEYTVKIGSLESELNISAATTVQGASYIIEGNKELKNKNVVTITVTSKDNTVVDKYSILVIKEKEQQDYSTYIYLGIIVFILLIVIIFVVKSSNKRNSEVEKQMSKFAKIFKKKEKLVTVNPTVAPNGTPVTPQQPVAPVQQPIPSQPVAPVAPVQSVQTAVPVQPVASVQQVVQPQPQIQPVAPVAPVQQLQQNVPVQQPVQPQQTVQQVPPNNNPQV